MEPIDVSFTVNGEDYKLSVEPHRLLVHTLREECGLTGTNIGCESTLCGACTIHVNGTSVKSCTMLTVQADGDDIRTVEGLASETDLHPIQQHFQQEHGLQCGYCTPGILMNATAYLKEHPDPDRDEIRNLLKGNICRCTGYQNIVNAIEGYAESMQTTDTE